MTESELQAAILLAHSRGRARLFRMNAGKAWQGEIIEHTPGRLVLAHPRAILLAPQGFADLCGWTATGQFAAIECKINRRKPTEEQLRFLDLVADSGGAAGVACSVADAERILRGG